MITSLQRKTDLSAKMKPKDYEEYQAEVAACQKAYEESKANFSLEGTTLLSIPSILPHQNDPNYANVIFDEGQFKILQIGEEKPEGVLTLQDGGNIPIVMASVLWYFGVKVTVYELAAMMACNGYRVHGKGVLHLAMDFIPEYVYGIKTEMFSNANEIGMKIFLERNPAVILAEAGYLQPGTKAKGNEAVCIWGFDEGDFLYTDPKTGPQLRRIDAKKLVLHSKKAWIFSEIPQEE